jgi:glutamate-1-semialdehyde 2,1-aminomutase
LIQAGSGAVSLVQVTAGTAKDTLLATYNDLENVKTSDANNTKMIPL